MTYPKDISENVIFRRSVALRSREDNEYAKMVYDLCSRDILFFFNIFLWAEDPFADKNLRHGIPRLRHRPIITYKFQDGYILGLQSHIELGEDDISKKSRDMLATYIVCGVLIHGWLFKGQKFLMTSRVEDDIDGKDDTSTLFGKIRYNLRRLPIWILPRGWDWGKCSSSMRLRNPENGGTIVGSAASAGIASGRREDAIFFDELSKWTEHAEEAWTSASDATKCKIAVWTPRGSGNFAARLWRGGNVKHKRLLMWYLHPEKSFTSEGHILKVNSGNIYDKIGQYVVEMEKGDAPVGCYVDQFGKVRSEWYDNECMTRDANDIAENLDVNELTTGNPKFDLQMCQKNKSKSMPAKDIGNLVWTVRPLFDSFGECTNKTKLKVEFIYNINGLWKIWEHPIKGWEGGYIESADTAEGLERGDFDSTSILRRFPIESLSGYKPTVVASLHVKIKEFEYADELAKGAVYYEMAWIIPERNNTSGGAVIANLFQIYQKIYHDDILSKGYPVKKDRLGFSTNSQTKGLIIDNLAKMISRLESGKNVTSFIDNDEGFWDECMTYVNNDGTLEGQDGSHDDRVMDRALLLWAHQELPSPTKAKEEYVYTGWREKRFKQFQGKSLVGWTV